MGPVEESSTGSLTSGLGGVTLTPDKNAAQHSVDGDTHIIINGNLSEEGQAKTFSHEGYGHGLLFFEGKPYLHQATFVDGQFKEMNLPLGKAIKAATHETENNYKSQ